MEDQPIEADYLVMGAGATGMAFADTLLTETSATLAIVDRHHRPGGHWNDSYPFVRLHQPSVSYGVSSHPLGSGTKDQVGFNKGFYELASGPEIVNYFDQVMRQRFLPSGRVQYFPMCNLDADGIVTAVLSGKRRKAVGGKLVDATYLQPSVPSTHAPQYAVGPGVAVIPPNALPRVAHAHNTFVVIGAGKTGMDSCLWLLENHVDPANIRWIMPRDFWMMNRAFVQPGADFFHNRMRGLTGQFEAVVHAQSVDDLFVRMEAIGVMLRLDRAMNPPAFHCAIVSEGECEALRRISNIVRMGHVERIDEDRVVLERGRFTPSRDSLYIDCTASALPQGTPKPVFAGNRITLQWVRLCQPLFSAAFIGHIEASFSDEAEKNRLCSPVPLPQVPADWLRMWAVGLRNFEAWATTEGINDWIASTRLDSIAKTGRELSQTDPVVAAMMERFRQVSKEAAAKIPQLLAS
jgi:NAD(P)-binding Rossmann-like domain